MGAVLAGEYLERTFKVRNINNVFLYEEGLNYKSHACCLIQYRNLFKWENKWFYPVSFDSVGRRGELIENSCIGNHAAQNLNLNTIFEGRIVCICKVLDIHVLVCLWKWLLIHVYWNPICISLQLMNSSSLSIDYCIKMDSLSLERHNIAQAVPAFIQANKTTKLSVGKWIKTSFLQRIKSIEILTAM